MSTIDYYDHPMSNPRGGWDKVCVKKINGVVYSHMSLLPMAVNLLKQSGCKVLVTEGGDLCLHESGSEIIVGNANLSCVSARVNISSIPDDIMWLSSNNNTSGNIVNFPLGLFKKPLDFHDDYFKSLSKKPRNGRALVNCDVGNNVEVRAPLLESLKKKDFVDIKSYAGQTSNDVLVSIWDELANYKYVICPASNGLDTCRIWEALYMGTTPVVESRYPYYLNISRDFPIICVPSLHNITLEQLEEEYDRICPKPIYGLSSEYWIQTWLAQ